MSIVDGHRLRQTPHTGSRMILHKGDTLEVRLELSSPERGTAWLRTNIGNGAERRREVVALAEKGEPVLARDWADIPMHVMDERHYSLTLPLIEVGRFEAKAFFLPHGKDEPVWPEGDNLVIKVEPAEFCSSNTVYTAFVRQFGPNKEHKAVPEEIEAGVKALDSAGYTVIPRSGTFRDLIKELDFIVGRLRCRIIQLLPIHPTPTVYAKMGRFGSPFAALDLMDVDPALAEFDKTTTPLEQFIELIDEVHKRSARIFIDIPVNHTGWASGIQIHHPEWFARGHDRIFQSPSAWGVVWEDLSKLNYENRELWKYMADVFLYWCEKGVDGFRCDAGYMIPFNVWEYIVAKVRSQFPDTIFMLEGLGGQPATVERLLDGANLDWAYSELFQNYNRSQIESYLPGCMATSRTKGLLIHFAETHDNTRLAAKSHIYSRLRTALTALTSDNGAFGITNGVEWFARERIDVHEASSINWGAADNQIDFLSTLHSILEVHPAFHPGAELRLIQEGHHNGIVMLRKGRDSGANVLVLANLDENNQSQISWHRKDFDTDSKPMYDLITGREVEIHTRHHSPGCTMNPGEVLCLTSDRTALSLVQKAVQKGIRQPERIRNQRLRAEALEIYCRFKASPDLHNLDLDMLATQLASHPRRFCLKHSKGNAFPGVTTWMWPRDMKRTVMVPPNHFLLIRAASPFSVDLSDGNSVEERETSLTADDGSHFAVLMPVPAGSTHRRLQLNFRILDATAARRESQAILYLADSPDILTLRTQTRDRALDNDCYALLTNGLGGMSQVRAAWGEIRSKYDAILAANLHASYPVDRTVMLSRFRMWLVYRGYSSEINRDCLRTFSAGSGRLAAWNFEIPSGMGRTVQLNAELTMQDAKNQVQLRLARLKDGSEAIRLSDDESIRIIIRPDVEDRSCHGVTKAFTGPESAWPSAVHPAKSGFTFAPSGDHRLVIEASVGSFHQAHEWHYMVGTPVDAERGLDASTDMFSPGYFEIPLKGGGEAVISAEILRHDQHRKHNHLPAVVEVSSGDTSLLSTALKAAMDNFIVRRDEAKTIIAGYPWFLDWGRDTFICLRGLIAAGKRADAAAILQQFGRFEQNGTVPNVLHGEHASNRDTSDAPLWFIVACSDLTEAEKSRDFLQTMCGRRNIRDVIISIANSYIAGTANGIRMDRDSGLIFSPPHFTWMDTNYPAATPRQGYPIEIQALWFASLKFLSTISSDPRWPELAAKVRSSIAELYTIPGAGYLADCRHADAGQTAAQAVADDALRPNQLFAITLGAVSNSNLCSDILIACEELLVPGAMRSLADRPVRHPIPVHANGGLLNDPLRPYWGRYTGDEDTRRKPSYHNGTAWAWLMPSFCEALYMTCGEPGRNSALAILSSCSELLDTGCIGHLPEITDGDSPHIQRGCGAQAWSVTEAYRILAILARLS